MSDARPAHERLLGIRIERNAAGRFVSWHGRKCPFLLPWNGLTEDELLAATDSLRALVFAERKKRA